MLIFVSRCRQDVSKAMSELEAASKRVNELLQANHDLQTAADVSNDRCKQLQAAVDESQAKCKLLTEDKLSRTNASATTAHSGAGDDSNYGSVDGGTPGQHSHHDQLTEELRDRDRCVL